MIDYGQFSTEKCGGHIHIGADFLKTEKSWENLAEMWGNTEKILYIISNKEGEMPREGIDKYASPFSYELENMLSSGSVEIHDDEDISKLLKKVQDFNRYHGINFNNVGHQKNTIEFRLSNGSIDEDTWIDNINLFGGIVKASEEIAIIQNKLEEERTDEEKEKLERFDRLKEQNISDEEKLEALLSITFNEEDREIYRDRFKTNNKLIKENSKVEKSITEKVAKSTVDIKKIGKKVFNSQDRVTGQEYKEVKNVIQELEQKNEKEKD